jgi:uncharacterized repeat protein (TIGR01451 family)
MSRVLRVLLMPAIALACLMTSAAAAQAAPDASLDVAMAPGLPDPPVLNLTYGYSLDVRNTGDVPLDGMTVIDTLPVEMAVSSVTTGSYSNLVDFAAGEGARVSYEKNTALGVFTLWGSSPNTTTNTLLTAPPPGLGTGEYLTRVRWEYGQAAAGMLPISRPVVRGQVINPDNAGGPVAPGDAIQNCAQLTTTGPEPLARSDCQTFTLIAGPSIDLQVPDSTPLGSPTRATVLLRGGAPTGTVTYRAYAASDTTCTTALIDEDVPVGGAAPEFPADVAGAYKWVVRYNGDSKHAPAETGCNDPAGAFAVVAPPAASAAFGAAVVDLGASTALTFTIENPGANTVPLTGVALEETLPDGLVVASPNGVTGTCGGTVTAPAGFRSISLAGGTVAVDSSCSFSVDVTGASPGPASITTGAVSSTNGGAGNTATASLSVRAPTATTVSCGAAVTVGEEVPCAATVDATPVPAGTVAFTTDGTGTFSADTCTLAPASGGDAGCEVRYTPSGDGGREDRITATYTPADASTWAPSAADTTVTVRARPAPPPPTPALPANPVTPISPAGPATAQALALACSPAELVLLSASRAGRRVRLRGSATPADAGQQVIVRTVRRRVVAARATVLPDGSFVATATLPGRRAMNKTRYYAELGERRSPPLKLTRRLTARLTATAGAITIRGRVTPPLGRPIRRVVIRRLTGCGSGYAVVARVRPDARGRFRVSLPRTTDAGPALYRAHTSVPTRRRGGGRLRTFALVGGVDPAR